MKPAPFVYFLRPIGQPGPVKIGCSSDPNGRLTTFMAWSPLRLEIAAKIPGDMPLEQRIHGIFADQHSHSEWFYPSKRLTDFINSLASGIPIGELIDLTAPVKRFRTTPKRPPISEDRRRCLSYSSRIRRAMQQLRTSEAYASEPKDVYAILGRWFGHYGYERVSPSPEEMARLDEILADPAAHAVMQPLKARAA